MIKVIKLSGAYVSVQFGVNGEGSKTRNCALKIFNANRTKPLAVHRNKLRVNGE